MVTFVFTRDFGFMVGNRVISTYDAGDKVEILEATDEDPHGNRGKVQYLGNKPYIPPLNRPNFRVRTKWGESIWTSIPMLVANNILREEK